MKKNPRKLERIAKVTIETATVSRASPTNAIKSGAFAEIKTKGKRGAMVSGHRLSKRQLESIDVRDATSRWHNKAVKD